MVYVPGVSNSTTAKQYALSIFFVAALCFLVLLPVRAFAADIITILPGASVRSSPSYFDSNFYLTKAGKTIKWYNTDDVPHKLILTNINSNGTSAQKQQIIESGIIAPNENFSYKFDNNGMYKYSSTTYPWKKGIISVSQDTNTTTVSQNMKNNIGIELTQQPINPKEGKETHFLINFINQKTNMNQKHVDYEFALCYNNTKDRILKPLFKQALHSIGGLEQAVYRFPTPGRYTAAITIYYVLFSPVTPDTAKFKIAVN
jgi:plastocyanin